MPTEASSASSAPFAESNPRFVDQGLLSPVSVDVDREPLVDDASIARALITAEVALSRAWAVAGVAPAEAADEISAAFGWTEEAGPEGVRGFADADLARLTEAAVAGGNPVIPLVGMLRSQVPQDAKQWIHRGATSQDILDTALMLVARDAALEVLVALVEIDEALARFAAEHRNTPAAGRTLTQHAVPTTVGGRAAAWVRGIARAAVKVDDAIWQLPAQLGGAGGTLASFALIGGEEVAKDLPAILADELALAVPEGPWHTTRWPITELGDALAQAVDALGVIAADITTLSRTEIGELTEGSGGGSSAMPQKQNPTRAVLIRSAAMRAPHLAASLHTASALAVDERPDGAWHAEWPTLRELLRLACGAARTAVSMVAGLAVDHTAVERNLALTSGLIVAERLSLELGPIIGADRVKEFVRAAGAGEALADLLNADAELAAAGYDSAKIAALLDPANYVGLAPYFVDELALDDADEPALDIDSVEPALDLPEENS